MVPRRALYVPGIQLHAVIDFGESAAWRLPLYLRPRPHGTTDARGFLGLGGLAASTERVRLGALVAGVPYRNPASLAKMCTTLDIMSHGRCIIGLGAGLG